MIFGLGELSYREIWTAPEGCDYAIQFRREHEREWAFMQFALDKREAFSMYSQAISHSMNNSEYRLVRLSRYVPCPVVQVIKYHKV